MSTNPAIPNQTPFSVLTVASPLHEPEALRPLLEGYGQQFESQGGCPWQATSPKAQPTAVFVATGGTERDILEAKALQAARSVLLVAHPGHNSLPAAMEALARLQQLGGSGQILYLDGPTDVRGWEKVREAVRHLDVSVQLDRTRIGMVGHPSGWLVASSPTPDVVRATWGPEVVPISMQALGAEAERVSDGEVDVTAEQICLQATAMLEPRMEDLRKAARIYHALRRLTLTHRLDALTLRCFDLVARSGTTGCLALGQLNDEGVIAGCEGDLVSAVTMVWAFRLTGKVPWMANPCRMDARRGVLRLAHCTVPRSLVESYRLRSHFESGIGASMQGRFAPGPITLVRVGGLRMERLWAEDATLVENTDDPHTCRTQVDIEIGSAVLEELLQNPLGNHLVLIAGHHAESLRRWGRAFLK